MISYPDLKDFFKNQKVKTIIAADAETRIAEKKGDTIIEKIPAGGGSVALDPIAKASGAVYIARGKNDVEKKLEDSRLEVDDLDGKYTLKRLFFSQEDIDSYYYGFSNQTLWPLCHVAWERPAFHKKWYEGFKKVNQKFAQSIKEEIKGKTFVWVNDYQLCLVPKYLDKPKNTKIAMFWHIPWPRWEVFRILPWKKDILESILKCDLLAFHRGYQARNFLDTVRRELEARIDEETSTIHYNGSLTTVKNLPMGIDTDVIKSLIDKEQIGSKENGINGFLTDGNRMILGVDRLDYTKGLKVRLMAIDRFFERNSQYIGKVVYAGILAPSREKIPAYETLKKKIEASAKLINKKYGTNKWQPIHLIYKLFSREKIVNFYNKADICLVTPLDDGMNLVSKEFVVASFFAKTPGMLVLSQFAGSAIDLTQALIVNPYDIDQVVGAIKKGLEMSDAEKIKRIKNMAEVLDEKNIYEWAQEFVRSAVTAG